MVFRILYVEDNPYNMDLVVRILTHIGGYEVLKAKDGQSGIHVAENEKPDLILMDLNLPDISGLDATTRIKANPALAHVPVVAFTANTSMKPQICYDAGCDGFVNKPADVDKLLAIVQQYL
ncbi:response regulator [Anaerolineales bacterium]